MDVECAASPRHANLPEQRGNVGIQGDRHHVDRRIVQRSRAAEAGAPVPIARPSAPVGTLRSLEVTISSMNPKPRHHRTRAPGARRDRALIRPGGALRRGGGAAACGPAGGADRAHRALRQHRGARPGGCRSSTCWSRYARWRTGSASAPLLRALGYEFFWRAPGTWAPGMEYAWFIRRDAAGRRTHPTSICSASGP